MYIPPHFAEQRADVLRQFMRDHPLSTFVTASPDGIAASHVPLVVHAQPDGATILRGHLSRANRQSRDGGAGGRALAIFHGPQAYITPAWYPTKRETGRVVPTWNYVVVHAEGPVRFIDDRSFLEEHLRSLTDQHEQGRAVPWALEDAPPDYLDAAIKGIRAFEIAVDRLEGKWKLTQNRSAADRAGVVEGLRLSGDGVMSELVRTAKA